MILAPGEKAPAFLLDTCALIYVFNGEPIRAGVAHTLDMAADTDGVYISPVSAWEIGLLANRKSPNAALFLPDAKTWFRNAASAPKIKIAPFNADIAIDSANLPEPVHRDPADRLLIATARELGIPIVTRDRLILGYAMAGHVDALAC